VVQIPMPGWVWSLERRKQWENALDHWRDIENLVIFVELPPATDQEAVLLSEKVPQLIWLVGSGMADAAETKAHLETLQHAGCNLVGAVLNYAPAPIFNSRLARWFQRMNWALVLAGTLLTVRAQGGEAQVAQNVNPELRPAVATESDRLAFGASARRKRAAWQERLTFGPGDTMDIHVFGRPGLTRTNILVGPDGRISFLQAGGIKAAGLTVEELRENLDRELTRYYKEAAAPRTIVTPVAYTSKKYFMLGKVNTKGAFVMDRPLTLIEAVARAKGLETGLYQRTTVEMADFGHSFLIRNGEKLRVDFEKLFQEGDLTQNVLLEPNDYVYFASTAANDIYVLGEVMNPGPLGFVPNATVLTAITDRGGYSDRAFKKRVLVVRGSLNQPETFVVDSGGSLDARIRDFRLEPRDIVYVSRRPWVRAEELLDEAASSFIQGAVTTWAGVNVGPIITKRLFPRTRPR
jgi:protein involved in polysaccharide export with SLBB domain